MRVDILQGLNQISQIEVMAQSSKTIANNKEDLIIRTSKDFNLDLDCESLNPTIIAEQEKLMQMANMLQGMGTQQQGAPQEQPQGMQPQPTDGMPSNPLSLP